MNFGRTTDATLETTHQLNVQGAIAVKLEIQMGDFISLEDEVEYLRGENQKLRNALEFYGFHPNWSDWDGVDIIRHYESEVQKDRGERARAALEGKDDNKR